MSEATGGHGRREVERRLIEKSLQDESFRERLLADPRAIVEQELGRELPADMQIRVVEETQDTIYLVLPSIPATTGELSDLELDSVAGGRYIEIEDPGSGARVVANIPDPPAPTP